VEGITFLHVDNAHKSHCSSTSCPRSCMPLTAPSAASPSSSSLPFSAGTGAVFTFPSLLATTSLAVTSLRVCALNSCLPTAHARISDTTTCPPWCHNADQSSVRQLTDANLKQLISEWQCWGLHLITSGPLASSGRLSSLMRTNRGNLGMPARHSQSCAQQYAAILTNPPHPQRVLIAHNAAQNDQQGTPARRPSTACKQVKL
jgi:hypothetical protein